MEQAPHCLHFDISRASPDRHYDIQDAEHNMQAYTVEVPPQRASGKPDLVLIPGTSRDPRCMVASSHFKKLSHRVRIGLGNPDSEPGGVRWEEMAPASRVKLNLVWDMTLPDRSRRTFAWKRSSTHGADARRGGLRAASSYKLVDVTSGGQNVIAVCTNIRGVDGHGKLQINLDLGVEFQVMVLMTFVSLLESR